jgi:hypothetical protein
MPLRTLNIFVDFLGQSSVETGCTRPHIHHIHYTVVAASQKHLLIDPVPSDNLYFVRVRVSISHLAYTFV